MLDIIRQSYKLDLAEIYSWGAVSNFKKLFSSADSLSSFAASNKTAFDTAVADTLKELAENAG